jgi:hypothetical protein
MIDVSGTQYVMFRPYPLIEDVLIFFQVVYTTIILPIAAARFSAWAGRPVAFQVTIFSYVVFMHKETCFTSSACAVGRYICSRARSTSCSSPALDESSHPDPYGPTPLVRDGWAALVNPLFPPNLPAPDTTTTFRRIVGGGYGVGTVIPCPWWRVGADRRS